jgi:AcrR family transcriptional regulator
MSPRTKDKSEQIRLSSKENIKNTALDLFAQKGFLSVTVEEIAISAGISKGLMYNYFKSKEALLDSIINDVLSDFSMYAETMKNCSSPIQRIENLIRMSFSMFKENKKFYSATMPLITQTAVSKKLRVKLLDLMNLAVLEINNQFRIASIPNSKIEALKLVSTLDGIAWQYIFVFKNEYPLKKMEENLIVHYRLLFKTNKIDEK